MPIDDRQLGSTRWSGVAAVELDVDGRRVVLSPESPVDATAADFGVDATGGYTAFELRLLTTEPRAVWRLRVDDEGELALTEERAP